MSEDKLARKRIFIC